MITADPGDRPVAMTVSSLISVSAAPPVVAFSLSMKSTSSEPVLRAETMVIHLLRFTDIDLAQLCASSGAERFPPGGAWTRLPTGEPRYTGVSTWFRARRLGLLPIEGATLVAAELLEGEVQPDEVPPEAHSLSISTVAGTRDWTASPSCSIRHVFCEPARGRGRLKISRDAAARGHRAAGRAAARSE